MARMIDLDQPVFVPIQDDTKGGAVYELQMTLEEFFDQFLPDFEFEVIDISDREVNRRENKHENQEADGE